MALPAILGAVAAVAAVGGVGAGVNGGVSMKKASKTLKMATAIRDDAVKDFELQNSVTTTTMDELGKKELEICAKFQDFSDVLEMIQGRPEFKEYNKDGITIPKYDPEELKKVSVGASVLIGGMGGATLGTTGGFAAAGVTTSAVMALGTASTGTPIAALSGAAATKATLAALGGGSIAAHGGGIALGTTMLGVSAAGIGILVGGVIFSITGTALSKKADEAYYQAMRIEQQVIGINKYLVKLRGYANKYMDLLLKVNLIYEHEFEKLKHTVIDEHKENWSDYSEAEKRNVRISILLVGLLYKMCQVSLVKQSETENSINSVNVEDIEKCMNVVNKTLDDEYIENKEE